MRERFYPIVGLAILCGCFAAGEFVKGAFHLVLPGNILGLFLLLALLRVGALPLRWVEGAAVWLLWLLPLLFMPLFIVALQDHDFWRLQGSRLGIAVAVATAVLWAAIGHAAQWLLRRGSRESAARP